jgi:hypothetical protein
MASIPVLATWDIRSNQCALMINKLYPCLSLFIQIMGKVFHTALSPLILERISQVANPADTNISGAIQVFFMP